MQKEEITSENRTSFTPRQNKNSYLIPGAIIVAGLIIAGAVFVTQRSTSFQPSDTKPQSSTENEAIGEISVDFEGLAVMGSAQAPITMVEYSDFACPFCGRFWQETLPLVKKDYIDTGKVRLFYKDFIVVGGDKGAEAAHCAKEQGKFWEYHDLLFSRQSSDRSLWSNPETHRGYAKELGLDVDALVECFESRRYEETVALSGQEAVKNGGRGTPFFLIEGQPIFGAQPYSAFQQVIDSLLAEK